MAGPVSSLKVGVALALAGILGSYPQGFVARLPAEVLSKSAGSTFL